MTCPLIFDLPSSNFDDRRDGQGPSLIILHYTGTRTAEEARDRFLDPAPQDAVGRISPHYLIDGNGQITRFVAEEKRAWHAGKACWAGERDINSASIGIELWNSGHDYDFEDFAPVQIQAVIDLIRDIRMRWPIADHRILGHSDVAPGRKCDPGEKFPWDILQQAGIGLMPNPAAEDDARALQWMDDPEAGLRALQAYGYDSGVEAAVLFGEFRRHFLPQTCGRWGVDLDLFRALASLGRQRHLFDSCPVSCA